MIPSVAIKQNAILAKAGIHVPDDSNADWWIPAFAGMTILVMR